MSSSSDIAFSESVKRVQAERGSRAAYARMEHAGGFETRVTDDLADFLRGIDTAYLATANAAGQPYIQHRGGPRGFIHAVDEHTLGWLELAGNKQFITTGNLRENDRVCLFLMSYERRQRVKVWGRAEVLPATPEWTRKLATADRRARVEQVMLLRVEAWDVNCPQHIPQKVDASEAAALVDRLQSRIAELEAENHRLRSSIRPARS
jgi:predicted pyridoxine 5'-phosphate oxidase superfamily flavin-nucleotide-binding protein